eukprot:TRINITY_DN35556_c0_g1_i1.p1 TRINITY_DN35556_c0_g1~~TRINITY_DN35556_c0_g1_i1.p1  ORF type:complete len:104 (-),score=26.11 TRINITY_DN35556_c0_g1_i1:27-338(-)
MGIRDRFTSSATNAPVHRGSFGGGGLLGGSDDHFATNSNHSQDMGGFGGSLASSGMASPNTDALVVRTNTNLPPVGAVSYTHLRAHETPEHLVCRLLLEKNTK